MAVGEGEVNLEEIYYGLMAIALALWSFYVWWQFEKGYKERMKW